VPIARIAAARRLIVSAAWTGAGLVSGAMPLLAHDGKPVEPHDIAGAWSVEPWVIAGLMTSLVLYTVGIRRLWSDAGAGRGIRGREAWCFYTGWLLLALGLVSPLHAMGEALLSAHMVQHEILMLAATPLLVLGRPMLAALWAIPFGWRAAVGALGRRGGVRAPWRWVTQPMIAGVIHAVAIWAWHVPTLYERSVRDEAVHALQHIAFIATALLFWWSILQARRSRSRDGQGLAVLFMTALHTGALGALLAFAPSLWYPVYAATTGPWGLSPIEDQQLAGMIMWIPGGGAYVAAGLLMALRWMGESRVRTRALRLTVPAALLLAVVGCRGGLDDERHPSVLGGNAERGKIAMSQYGCPSCHVIPGIAGAEGTTGPPLTGIASRGFIAGVMPNTPGNMVRWIMDPPRIDSLTAMPALGISDTLARDMAEYLYRIR
jgi:cytochrome c oxidase assembly factor CtaG